MEEEKAFLVPREKGVLSEAAAQLGVCNLEVTHFKWPLCESLPWGRLRVQKPSLCSSASPVPLPSPCYPKVSLLHSAPLFLGSVRPSSTHFSLQAQSYPLHLPRLPTPTFSPMEGWKCFCPADPALISSRLWPQLKSPTRRPGLGHRLRNGKNWGAGGSEPEGKEGEQPGHTLRGTHPGQRLVAGQAPWAGK